jgi:hypothetical protein
VFHFGTRRDNVCSKVAQQMSPSLVNLRAVTMMVTRRIMSTVGVEVMGVFLQALARACVNLRLLVGQEAAAACAVEPGVWYPASRFVDLFERVTGRFPTPEPIKERIGVEMMKLWYDPGPGRAIIKTAVDFLRYQTGSAGYHSLTRGPADAKGAFLLEALDEGGGRAVVCSTTPFDRTMERGVLIGGLGLTADIRFVSVDNAADPSIFAIEIH